jgi:cysteine desulfurase/selenocysteine lyase
MSNRRDFLKNSILLAGAIGLGSSTLQAIPPMPPMDADDETYWKLVRNQFPLSQSKIFLNNGTVGPSPYVVLHEVQQDMLDVESSGRYGGHEEGAIKALSEFLNTRDTEISLMRNVTEGINVACWGMPRNLINKKTKVISVPQIPCTIGQILPVKEICRLAREKGIFSFIDGAHPPGMLVVDIKDIGCDFYAGCCHKWMLGPKGTGFLYVSEGMRDTLQVYYGGGGFDKGWDMLSNPPVLKGYIDNGHRYYYGTQNASLFKGITKAIEFQNQIGRERIETRVRQLATYLQDNLIKLSPDVEMITPTENISRGAQVSFKIKNKDVSKLHEQCQGKQIITRYVPENNINCMRISTHIYNSFNDVDAFLLETDKFIKA